MSMINSHLEELACLEEALKINRAKQNLLKTQDCFVPDSSPQESTMGQQFTVTL